MLCSMIKKNNHTYASHHKCSSLLGRDDGDVFKELSNKDELL